MNVNNILSADILDILFDGRNKAYGAYQIRRTYNRRLGTAIAAVLLACALLVAGSLIKRNQAVIASVFEIPDDTLRIQTIEPVEPPLRMPQETRVRQVSYTLPVIVPEEIVAQSLPTMSEVENAIIGTTDEPGAPDDGNVPSGTGPAISTAPAVAPVQEIPDDTVLRKVEVEARFNGDWRQFLERNLVYPEEAIENEKGGIVKVQFIVDKDGDISDITALNDPGYSMAEEAIRIIKRSHWIPAEQNGRRVNYIHVQTIIFQLQ